MAILYVGSEAEGLEVAGGISSVTSPTTYFDNNYVRGALVTTSSGSVTMNFTASSELWFHESLYTQTVAFGLGDFILVKSGSIDILRVGYHGGANPKTEYWNGSAWVEINENGIPIAVLMDIDIHIKIDAVNGHFKGYRDGALVWSFVGDTTQSGATSVDKITLSGAGGVETYHSQMLVQTSSTLGYKVETIAITADSTTQDWTGDYTDIDDVLEVDNSDSLYTTTADQEANFAVENGVAAGSRRVVGVVNSVAVSRGDTGPQNMQFILTSGGTKYYSDNVDALDLGQELRTIVYTTDPATGLGWDQDGLNALELGYKSIT